MGMQNGMVAEFFKFEVTMSEQKNFIRKYGWAIGLSLSVAYVIFEGLVQNGYLSIHSFNLDSTSQRPPHEATEVETQTQQGTYIQTPLGLPSKSDQERGRGTSPSAVQEATSDNPLVTLEGELTRILLEKGISPSDANLASQRIVEIFKTPPDGTDRITTATDSVAASLHWGEEKKKLLREALLASFAETGGTYTLSQLEQCMQHRLKVFKPDECGRQKVEDLLKKLAEKVPEERITPELQKQIDPLADQARRHAMQECGMDSDSAFRLFSIHLQDCK